MKIAAGHAHVLAVTKSGAVVAWGANSSGQCSIPVGLVNVVAVAAGRAHSLALTQSGDVVAWGNNFSNQCNIPPELHDIVQVAAGYFYSLALTQGGSVVVWGAYTALPTKFTDINDMIQIAAFDNNLIALRRDGTVVQGFFGDPTDVPLDIRATI